MPAPDPAYPHPDPLVESALRMLGESAKLIARMGATEHARERFEQAVRVGESSGPFASADEA